MHTERQFLETSAKYFLEAEQQSLSTLPDLRRLALLVYALLEQATIIEVPILIGCTVADVERDLILETLKHCLGNRTHAANTLGISIRTLRNKLNEYASDGLAIPPPRNSTRDAISYRLRGGAKS